MHSRRHDTHLSAAVDLALQVRDVRIAAHLLEQLGVAFPLICRVLMEPNRRRATVDLAPASS